MPVTYAAPRGKIYDNILETVGGTPLVRAPKFSEKYGFKADVVFKLEFFNPLNSVKDRLGLAMIEAMEADGTLTPGKSVIVEPTSGNTGIALAFVAAVKGYRCVLVMPDSMSIERRKMLTHFGAELHLTPAAKGLKFALERADELQKEIPDAVIPMQFKNPANPEVHRNTTAEEIWADTDGKIDGLIAGVGTGGTLTGVSEVLKGKNPDFKTYAVEPEGSPVLSGGTPGPHKIQGIGAGFVPEVLKKELMDEVVKVSNDDAFALARELALLDGIPVGISSGAALKATIEVASREENAGKRLVVILASMAERYISTPLFAEPEIASS